jgi:hypothetical protein
MTLFASAIVIVAVALMIPIVNGWDELAEEVRRAEDWEDRDHGPEDAT